MGRVVCIRVGSLAVAIHNAYLLSRLGRLGRGLATLSALPVAAGLLAASAPLLARAGRSTICCAHPSDDLLIRRFAAHRQEFDRLVAMSQADARVIRVAPDFTRLEDDWVGPGPTLSWDSRLNAGGNTGGSLPGSTLGPALNGGGKGLTRRHIARLYPGDGTGGSTKGYVYSPTARVPTYPSLDSVPPDLPSNVTGYRHLSGPWYLFCRFSWNLEIPCLLLLTRSVEPPS